MSCLDGDEFEIRKSDNPLGFTGLSCKRSWLARAVASDGSVHVHPDAPATQLWSTHSAATPKMSTSATATRSSLVPRFYNEPVQNVRVIQGDQTETSQASHGCSEYRIDVPGTDMRARLIMPADVPPPPATILAAGGQIERRSPVMELNMELQYDDSDNDDNDINDRHITVTPPPVSPPTEGASGASVGRVVSHHPGSTSTDIAAAVQAAFAAAEGLGDGQQQA